MWDCRFTACLNTRQAQYQLEWLMESLSQRREKTKRVTQCWSLLNVCKAPCSALRRRDKVTNLFQLNISIQSVELFSGLVSSSAFTTLHISMPCFQFLRQKPWCHLDASPPPHLSHPSLNAEGHFLCVPPKLHVSSDLLIFLLCLCSAGIACVLHHTRFVWY